MSYCTVCEPEEFQILKELADLQMGHSPQEQRQMTEKTRELAERRWKETQENLKQLREQLEQHEEELFSEALEKSLEGQSSSEIAQFVAGNEQRQKLKDEIAAQELEPKEVSHKDVKHFYDYYERKGYIDIQEGKIKLTSRGTQFLGRVFLWRMMQNLEKRGVGTHRILEVGVGSAFSRSSRAYELGDTYDSINIEQTLLNVLERNRKLNQIKSEDFEVFESLHQTKVNVGIIIDESRSMDPFSLSYYQISNRRKIDSAIETSLALSEFMRTNYPQDRLRIFAFSEEVKEIQPWEVLTIQVPMRCTDIRKGLRAYRTASAHEEGDKQVYLITDTEPNFENGRYVGFRVATQGVLKESAKYREDRITLNIFMLDQSPHLKDFARLLARQSVGRVVFTSPENLGEAILEDYLTSKREKLLRA